MDSYKEKLDYASIADSVIGDVTNKLNRHITKKELEKFVDPYG